MRGIMLSVLKHTNVVDKPMSGRNVSLNSVLMLTCDVCLGYGLRVMCLCRLDTRIGYMASAHTCIVAPVDKQLYPVFTE